MVFCRSRLSVGGVWGVGQGRSKRGRSIGPTTECGKTVPSRAHRVYIVCSVLAFAMNATSRTKRPFPTGRDTSHEPPNQQAQHKPPAALPRAAPRTASTSTPTTANPTRTPKPHNPRKHPTNPNKPTHTRQPAQVRVFPDRVVGSWFLGRVRVFWWSAFFWVLSGVSPL